MKVPVRVRWTAPNGAARDELTETQVVSSCGCLLTLKSPILDGTEIELVNVATKGTSKGRVIWCGAAEPGKGNQVGIDFDEADSEIWGGKYEEIYKKHTLSTAIGDTWVG
jgi:hypothetical protein